MANNIEQIIVDGITYNLVAKGFPDLPIKGTATLSPSGGSITSQDIKYALTEDRTMGMIWGEALVKALGSTTLITCSTGIVVAPQDSVKTIKGYINVLIGTNTNYTLPYFEIDTNGNVNIKYALISNNTSFLIPPVLIRFSDF